MAGLLSAKKLKRMTYREPHFSYRTLDSNLPKLQGPIPDWRCSRRRPKVDLGQLEKLSPLLLQNLLNLLDIHSLTVFRRVNRRAMQIVGSMPQSNLIIKYAYDVIRGLVKVGLSRKVSWGMLSEKLGTAGCEECGILGAYIYLLTCQRICFKCVVKNEKYLPRLPEYLTGFLRLSRKEIDTLPRMRSVPGIYASAVRTCRERLDLVDYASAFRIATANFGSEQALQDYINEKTTQHFQEEADRMRLLQIQARKERAAQGTPRDLQSSYRPNALPRFYEMAELRIPFDAKSSNPLRFMAVVRAPWLDQIAQKVEWGFHCLACEDSEDSHTDTPMTQRKFDAASFCEHLKEYGPIDRRRHVKGKSLVRKG